VGERESCINVSDLWYGALMLRARMGIRAHPTLTSGKTSTGPFWHPVSRLRRADRSSISSFHLADLGGEAVEAIRYLTFQFSLIIGG